MPNRILREGILTSERVARLGWPAEVFYRRLMSVVDDFGRYYATPMLLRAACYPLHLDKVSDSDIGKWLAVCAEADLVRVYPAEDGKRYLQLVDFRQQVRAAASKFPQMPSGCAADAQQVHSNSEASAHLDVFGVGDVDDKPPHPPAGGGFDRFWTEWPAHKRKVGRAQCEAKWRTRGCEAIADRIVEAVRAARESADWLKDDGEFIPAPLVWLNQSRWEGVESVPVKATETIEQYQARMAAERAADRARATPPPASVLAIVGRKPVEAA